MNSDTGKGTTPLNFNGLNVPSTIGKISPDPEGSFTSNQDLFEQAHEPYSKMLSPSILLNFNPCPTIEKEMQEISKAITEIYPQITHCPYSFSDVKVLKDQTFAVAISFEGFVIYVNLCTKQFQENKISDCALSTLLVFSQETHAFVKEKDYGIIYIISIPLLEVENVLKVEGKGLNGIGRMCLSSDELFLYARLWRGEIIRWDLQRFSGYTTVLSDKNILCMSLSPDNTFVIGTFDNRIRVYSLIFEKICEKTFDFQPDAFINFSEYGDLIILLLADSVKILKKRSLEVLHEITTHSQALQCILTTDERYLIMALDSGEVAFYDFITEDYLNLKVHTSSVQSIHFDQLNFLIYSFGKDSKMSVIRFPRLTMFKSSVEINFPFNAVLINSREKTASPSVLYRNRIKPKEESFKPLCMAQSEKNDLIIVGGESNNITVWDRITMKKHTELIGHSGFVFSLATLNDEIMASGSADSKVIIWNFRKSKKIAVLSGHTQAVSAVVKIDMDRVASGSWDKTLKIWTWASSTLVFTINDFPEKIVALCTPKYNKLLVGMKNLIHCWDLQSYCLMFEKESVQDITCFRIFEDVSSVPTKIFIGLGMDDDSLWIENPFISNNFEIWGKSESATYDFIKYIREIMMFEVPHFLSEMDKFTIFPYKLNILHFYAYFNIPNYLYLSISNGTPLINSSSYSNPLSIAIEMKNYECVEAIIQCIWEKHSKNPFLLSVIPIDTLRLINYIDSENISKIYKILFNESCYSIKVNPIGKKFPQILPTNSYYKFLDNLENNKNKKHAKLEVQFSQSLIPFHLSPGSLQSIEFLISLYKCKNNKIFETRLLQKFLQFKVEKVKFWILGEFLIFFLYFVWLLYEVFQIIDGQQGVVGLNICGIILGNLLGAYDITYAIIVLKELKFLSILMIVLLEIFAFIGSLEKMQKIIFPLLFITSSIWGLNYLNLFPRTRVNLIVISNVFNESIGKFGMILYCFIGLFVLSRDMFKGISNKESEIDDSENFSDMPDLSYLILNQNFVFLLMIFGFLIYLTKKFQKNANFFASTTKSIISILLKAEYFMFWNRELTNREFLRLIEVKERKKKSITKKTKILIKEIENFSDFSRKETSDKKELLLKNISELTKSLTVLKESMLSERKTHK